ncbi:MAG: carboxypeptidase-like regulatory domain-containing protein [Terracidiphilus sp.]
MTIAAPLAAQIEIRTLHLASVQGLVTDRMGRPVGNARVYLVSATDGTAIKETRTDSLGRFNLGRLDGSYWFRVDAKGFSAAGDHMIVGLNLPTLLHSSRLHVMLGPQACMDDCSPIWTNKRRFEHSVRWNNGKFE